MRKMTLIVTAILFIALAAMFAGCEKKGPMAVVEGDATFNFGTVEQQGQVEHSFVLRNDGDMELVIQKVRSSCGCTVANPTKETMKPGETSEIKAVFSVGRRKGPQTKKITVITNDPNNQKIALTLTGEVKTTMLFDPERLAFNDIKPEVLSEQTVKLTNQSEKKITFTETKIKEPKIDFIKVKLIKNGSDQLPIELNPGETMDIVFSVTIPKDQPRFFARLEMSTAENANEPIMYSISGRQEGAAKMLNVVKKKDTLKKQKDKNKNKNKKNKNKKKKQAQ